MLGIHLDLPFPHTTSPAIGQLEWTFGGFRRTMFNRKIHAQPENGLCLIASLTPTLRRLGSDTRWQVFDKHTSFDFVAMLTARTGPPLATNLTRFQQVVDG